MPHDIPSSKSPPLPTAVLDRVLAGQLTDGDAERLADWLADPPARDAILHALRTPRGADPAARVSAESALRALTRRIDAIERSGTGSTASSVSRARRWGRLSASPSRASLWIGCALVALGIAVAGVYQWTPWGADFMRHGRVYATRTGQRQTVTLDDSTRVTLAPGESRTVTIHADPKLLLSFDERHGDWRRPVGDYRFYVGKSAGEPAFAGTVRLVAAHQPARR